MRVACSQATLPEPHLDAPEMQHTDHSIFGESPPFGLLQHFGIAGDHKRSFGRRAAMVVLIGWVPLVVLAGIQGAVLRTDAIVSLLWATGVHARFLLAAPLLVLAGPECTQRLGAIVRHFVGAGLVPENEQARFDAAVASTRRLAASHAVEVAAVAITYLLVAMVVISQPLDQIPAWHKAGGEARAFSPAGWWHVLVSLPLLVVLLLGWLARLALWSRLLWLIARLDLRLMASHPDRAAGLGFVGYSVRAFSVVALALATIIAGRAAGLVLAGDALPTEFFVVNGALLAAIVTLLVAPLFVFTPALMKAWARSALAYDALAHRFGSAFENKWIGRDVKDDAVSLDKRDCSTTIDLYSIVANVSALRLVPIDIKSIAVLGSMTLLPFVPVAFLTLPSDQIVAVLKKLLF